MPQKHEPLRLELLAVKSVGEWVKEAGRGLIEPVYVVSQRDPNQGQLFLQGLLKVVRDTLFAHVPWCLIDITTVQVLSSINELINETKSGYNTFQPMAVFLNQMKVVVNLTVVAMHRRLKKVNVSEWPKIMRYVLNQNLKKLVGLEDLNLGSGSAGWDTTETEKFILTGIRSMSNLTTFCLYFDCTNSIITTLSENCPALQNLDITSSKSVTDRSIPSLLNCKRLREVNLYRTSVSPNGFKDLLLGLPSIQNIGKSDDFGKVFESLHEHKPSPLCLVTLQCKDMTFDQLNLLIEYCPRLSSISLFHDERIADLTVLKKLQHLKELKILNCDFFGDHLKQLLETQGQNLDHLHLEHVDEIDFNSLIYISQYCPKLTKLDMHNCEFFDHASPSSYNTKMLCVSPYSSLEQFVCAADCTPQHLEFMMKHCKNIQSIKLGSSTGIDNATMSRILQVNPMKSLKELKILYSHDLGMQTVQLLMNHCENLQRLSELESWGGISESELREFREYLRLNNINLNINPTLSRPSH